MLLPLDAREVAPGAALPRRQACRPYPGDHDVTMCISEDIERIRQLKYRYFRAHRYGGDIELLRGVLAKTMHIDYHGGTYRMAGLKAARRCSPPWRPPFNEPRGRLSPGPSSGDRGADATTATGMWYLTDVFINLRGSS